MVCSLSFAKIVRSIRKWGKVHRIRRSSVSSKKIPSSFGDAYRRITLEWGRLMYNSSQSSDETATTGEMTTTNCKTVGVNDRCPDVKQQEIREELPFSEEVKQKSSSECSQFDEIVVEENAEHFALTDGNAAKHQIPTYSPAIHQPACPTPSLRQPVSQQHLEVKPTADVVEQPRPSTHHQLGYILSLLTQVSDQNQRHCSLEQFVVQV